MISASAALERSRDSMTSLDELALEASGRPEPHLDLGRAHRALRRDSSGRDDEPADVPSRKLLDLIGKEPDVAEQFDVES